MLRNAKPLPGHATAKPLVKEEPLNPQQQQPCATAMPAQQQRGAPSAAALVPPRHDLLTKKRRFANRGVLLEVEAGEDPRSKPSQSIQRNNDDNNTNSTIHDPLWQDFGLSRCRARSDQQQQNAPPKKKPRSRPTAQKRGPPRRGAAPNNSATAFTLFPTKTTTTEPTTTKRSQLSLSKNAKQDEPGPLPGVVGIGEGPTYTGTTTATATASIPPTGPGDSVVSSETRTIPTPPGCNNKNNNIHWSRNIVHALILASYKTNNNKTKNGNIQGFYQHVRHSCPPTATTIDTKAQPPDTPSPPACFVFPDTRRMPPPPPRVPWTIPSWLRLVQHPHDDGMPGSSRRKKVVSAMAWDTTGELLAVGFAASGGGGDAALTSQVNIYNWDTVVAANMKGRRLQQRRLMSNRRCGCEQTVPSGSRERTSPKMALDGLFVPPAMIIPISCRSSISMLEWNPFNPDELAVGERSSGAIRLFDLNDVGEWQENIVTVGHRANICKAPCRELVCSDPASLAFSHHPNEAATTRESSFRFLDGGNYAILSAGMTLYCWSMKREVTLFWKWSWKRSSGDVITSMESLTEDTVVLGTRTGLIAILDWKNVKRASFSYTVSPTLVDSWESYMNDQQISTPPARGMGIRKLTVAKEIFPGELVRYKLVWLTTCGWVLSSMVEYSPRRNDSTSSRIRRMKRCFEVLFETDPITWKSATGDVVSDDVMKSWVMPTEPIPSFASESVLIWNKFNDDVTRILPHHDQRVLAPLASTINEARGQPKIQWMSIGKPTCNTVRAKQVETRSIRLSTRAGLPTHLAVHPSHEWIVISTAENGMYLVHSTSKLR